MSDMEERPYIPEDAYDGHRSRSASPPPARRDYSRSKSRSRSRSRSRSPVRGPPAIPSGEPNDGAYKADLEALYASNHLKRDDISDKVLDEINCLPSNIARDVIASLASSNMSDVRNPNGFTIGIINRIKKGEVTLDKVLPPVKAELDRLMDDEKLAFADLTHVSVGILCRLSEASALEALEAYNKDLNNDIRNRSGFFTSIMKRVERETMPRRDFGGGRRYDDRRGRGGGGGGGGRRYSPDRRGGGGGGRRYDDRRGGDRRGDDRGGRDGGRWFDDERRGGGGGGGDRRDRGGDRYDDRRGGGGRDRYDDARRDDRRGGGDRRDDRRR